MPAVLFGTSGKQLAIGKATIREHEIVISLSTAHSRPALYMHSKTLSICGGRWPWKSELLSIFFTPCHGHPGITVFPVFGITDTLDY